MFVNPGAEISSVELHAGGRWLQIKIKNVGIQSELFFHRDCTFGSIEIRGIGKDEIRSLRDKLIELCETWKVSSGKDQSFQEEE